MSEPLCCTRLTPYKSRPLDHEAKFSSFMAWLNTEAAATSAATEVAWTSAAPTYAVQLVRQVNFGPIESKRYFAYQGGKYTEITEADLIEANFKKLNTFKNFKCSGHNKFFEVNIYQKDPHNAHHWRADIDRPAGQIDL